MTYPATQQQRAACTHPSKWSMVHTSYMAPVKRDFLTWIEQSLYNFFFLQYIIKYVVTNSYSNSYTFALHRMKPPEPLIVLHHILSTHPLQAK